MKRSGAERHRAPVALSGRDSGAASFPERVYALVRRVPRGRVITYGAIAWLLGDPRQARQVGWAMAAPRRDGRAFAAHRVINARGELSGGAAFGGYAAQRARLEVEGVSFLPDGRVDLDVYLWLPGVSRAKEKASPKRERPFRETVAVTGT